MKTPICLIQDKYKGICLGLSQAKNQLGYTVRTLYKCTLGGTKKPQSLNLNQLCRYSHSLCYTDSKNIKIVSEGRWEVPPLEPYISAKIYKGSKKCIKGKNCRHVFQFFYFETIFLINLDSQVRLLWSRRFFRHQDQPYRPMSYFDVICII